MPEAARTRTPSTTTTTSARPAPPLSFDTPGDSSISSAGEAFSRRPHVLARAGDRPPQQLFKYTLELTGDRGGGEPPAHTGIAPGLARALPLAQVGDEGLKRRGDGRDIRRVGAPATETADE